MTAYRTPPSFAGRCSRGHLHTAKAIGGYCCIPPCVGIEQGGRWEPARRIDRIEVTGGIYPNAQYEHPRSHEDFDYATERTET